MTTASRPVAAPPTEPRDIVETPWDAAERVPLYVWCLLGSLVFNLFSGYSDLMGFPIGPDRVLLAAALGLLVIARDRPVLVWRPVYAVMIALVLWTGWSALTHGTLLQKDGLFAFLDRIIVPFGMFVLGALVFTTERRRHLLLRTVTLIGVYLGLTAIFEIFGPHSLVWPRYIMDPEVGILFGRARGPFATAEPNGMVMGLALFMAMTLWHRERGIWRLVATLAVPLSGLGVVLCLTRSTWLATIVAGLLLGWFVPSIRRRLPVIVGGLVALFAVVLLSVPAAADALNERFNMVSSVYDRQNTNAAGLRIVEEHPIFGIGWHKFIEVGTDWVRQADDYPVTNVVIEIHNVFLSRAAETGIPGSAMWLLAFLMGPALAVWKMPRAGYARTWALLALAAICYWVVPSMTSPNSYPLPNNLMWLIGGFASARFLVRRPAPVAAAPASVATPDPTQESTHERS